MKSEFDMPEIPETPEAVARRRAALAFSQNYVALFVHNPVGVLLLKQWTDTYANKRTPINAPITEYAANEAVRAFVQGIHHEIKIAQDAAMR